MLPIYNRVITLLFLNAATLIESQWAWRNLMEACLEGILSSKETKGHWASDCDAEIWKEDLPTVI